MSLLLNWRVWVFGLLSWLIPFAASVPFFDSSGAVVIDHTLFKSLMVVIGGASGVALLVVLFRKIDLTAGSALLVGLVWLALNWALDILILVPMSGTSVTAYFYDIGLRYLVLPITAVGFGLTAQAQR